MFFAQAVSGVLRWRNVKVINVLRVARSFAVPVRRLTSSPRRARGLTVETMNPCVREMEYAVRGKVPIEAMNIQQNLQQGTKTYPFHRVLFANIGDCHAMGQKPLTFVRQLLAATVDPTLVRDKVYPYDVAVRADNILTSCSGNSLGSYTDSRGITHVRESIARFISQRDHIESKPDSVYLVNGATEGIKMVLSMCQMYDQPAGIMIPIPQYPLYTATIAEQGAYPIKYYLDEPNDWAITTEELQTSISASRSHCKPRVMVVINPGNPTGQHLSEENMRNIIKFCHNENLLIIADEVYQNNVWTEEVEFKSFRKVLLEMGPQYNTVQLVSFNSTSKGFVGECGIRGGYMDMTGFDETIMDQFYKLASTKLCANSPGQVVTDVMVNPPQPGEPSYELFEREKKNILDSLKRRAIMVYERFNSIDGVSCNRVDGAMYAFPRIEIPEAAAADAAKEDPKMQLDEFYCLEFLRQQGVCVVPGSGFGQLPGTWHFRMTILPPEPDLNEMLTKFKSFHNDFVRKYTT